MFGSVKKFITFSLCMILLTGIMQFPLSADDSTSVEYENIGIGGGGSFYAPLINPADSNNYVVFSDMNDLYFSYDAGESWERTETYVPLLHSCFSEDGSTLYAGGNGLYASCDNGKTLDIIYPHPSTVKKRVSILGRNDNCIISTGDYNNCYVLCVTEHNGRVYFITMDWSSKRQLRLQSCAPDGTDLTEYYRENTMTSASPMKLNYKISADDNSIYYSDGKKIMKYTFDEKILSEVYSAVGTINDFKLIDETFFILDDTDEKTFIFYTRDFIYYDDLAESNTLPSAFTATGIEYSFEWHYTMIAGNNLNSLFIVMNSDIDDSCPLNSDLGGVLKYDGVQFEWAYDPVYKTNRAYHDASWTTYAVDPIYGICNDPNDDSHCLMTNIHSVYDIYYDESYKDGQMQHCTVKTVDDVNYYSSTGLDCQTTYFVHEDPFDSQHIIISTTDIGLQISYDGGKSFRRVVKQSKYWSAYNTCYDLYFDENTEDVVYGLWSSRHDAPNTVPNITDKYAKGYFAISLDGGINWDFTYSSGIPENSIPVKMSVVPNGEQLTIAVATFNNGFYISYDSGVTFESISDDMRSYDGMIWGEDVVIIDDMVYCLTSYHTYVEYDDIVAAQAKASEYPAVTNAVPSVLYVYDLKTCETHTVDLGDIVIARSLTYDEDYGLFINVIPYYYWGWIDEIQANYYINYGGGVYYYNGDCFELILPIENGASDSAFAPNGVMYVNADKGTIYYKEPGDTEFHVYADGLFTRMKNISFSLDGNTLYATTLGGGTYRMPTLQLSPNEYTVTFVDYDNTIISKQIVTQGSSPAFPNAPIREPDIYGHYTFVGWDSNSTNIEGDLTLTAVYEMAEHTTEIRGAYAPTCTAEGYSGDTYCSVCEMLIEEGHILQITEHISGNANSNNDGTHTYSCEECDKVLSNETCIDADNDGCCDICAYKMNLTEFTKVSSFTNGKQYLIVGSNKALLSSISSQSISLEYSSGYYITSETIPENMLWTYDNGYLYTQLDGYKYYLTAYRGFQAFSYTLSAEPQVRMASTWSYKNGYLSTMVNDWWYRTTKYLNIDKNGNVTLSSRANIDLYQLEN